MKRYIDVFLKDTVIKLKEIREYKANMFFSLLISFTEALVSLIFIGGVFYSVKDIIPWTSAIFIFYVLYFEGMMNLFETFYVATRLHKYILAGDLNNYLIRPLGVGFQYMLASSRIRPFFTSIAFFICLIVYVIVSDITFSLSRLFPTLLFSIIAGLTMISVIRFTDSFSFFFKQPVSIRNIYSRMAHVYNRFPGVIFTGGLRKLAMMFPNVYFGAFAIHYLFGFSDLSTLYLQTGILLILLLISFVGTLLIWKVGMRNYEAYN